VLVVVTIGAIVRAPLSRIPENLMKFAVGVMLSSFGMFWGTEGAGADWPGGELALLAIVPAVLVTAIILVRAVTRGARRRAATSAERRGLPA